MRRITSPDRLNWTVKRLVVPTGMRPPSAAEMLDVATPRRTVVHGVPGTVPDAMMGVTGPLPLGALFSVVLLPLVPLALALRYLGLARWTIEARAYPWGRRYPPAVLTYLVGGRVASARAVDELAAALERGEGAPVLAGGEFVAQARLAHDGSADRPIFSAHRTQAYRRPRR